MTDKILCDLLRHVKQMREMAGLSNRFAVLGLVSSNCPLSRGCSVLGVHSCSISCVAYVRPYIHSSIQKKIPK